jgi:hypothetical protein
MAAGQPRALGPRLQGHLAVLRVRHHPVAAVPQVLIPRRTALHALDRVLLRDFSTVKMALGGAARPLSAPFCVPRTRRRVTQGNNPSHERPRHQDANGRPHRHEVLDDGVIQLEVLLEVAHLLEHRLALLRHTRVCERRAAGAKTAGCRQQIASTALSFTQRVRGEIMGPGKYENVEKSQSVLNTINPLISPHTRTRSSRTCRNSSCICSHSWCASSFFARSFSSLRDLASASACSPSNLDRAVTSQNCVSALPVKCSRVHSECVGEEGRVGKGSGWDATASCAPFLRLARRSLELLLLLLEPPLLVLAPPHVTLKLLTPG